MSRHAISKVPILIASDSEPEAALVKSLLDDEFDNVSLSISPNAAARDFQRHRPDVLVLAFKQLQKAEDFYLGLFRLGSEDLSRQHRAVILCTKEEVTNAYQLWRRGLVDDYVLFWPVTHDVTRLLMSVSRAVDDLRRAPNESELTAMCAAQARRLKELEEQLSEQLHRGDQHIESTGLAVAGAERDIGTALNQWSARLRHTRSQSSTTIDGLAGMVSEIERINNEIVVPTLQNVSATLQPLNKWVENVQQTVAPYRESLRAVSALATQARPSILVIDDDEYQRKLTARILESENYELTFAAGGIEALSVLSTKARPDLILMDYLMPDVNGIELTQRIKSDPRLATIPVIMITGSGERGIVLSSIKSGAVDFIVKPFYRDTAIGKIERVLKTYGVGGSTGMQGTRFPQRAPPQMHQNPVDVGVRK